MVPTSKGSPRAVTVRIQVPLYSAYLELAQEVAYSCEVYRCTAYIEWTQEAAYSNAAFHNTANTVWAQEADCN